jgi:hypothetical protein
MVRVPPRYLTEDPEWLRKAATEDLRWAAKSLDGKMEDKPFEIERQLRLDGDGEAWWVVRLLSTKKPR